MGRWKITGLKVGLIFLPPKLVFVMVLAGIQLNFHHRGWPTNRLQIYIYFSTVLYHILFHLISHDYFFFLNSPGEASSPWLRQVTLKFRKEKQSINNNKSSGLIFEPGSKRMRKSSFRLKKWQMAFSPQQSWQRQIACTLQALITIEVSVICSQRDS